MTDKASLPVRGIEPYQPAEGEEYMNEAQLAHFQAILEAWKKQLQEEVERTVSHMRDDANHYADPADRATQEEEFALSCAPATANASSSARSTRPWSASARMTTDSAISAG